MRAFIIAVIYLALGVSLTAAYCGNPTVDSRDVTTANAIITDGNVDSPTVYGSGTCRWRFHTNTATAVVRLQIRWNLGMNYDRMLVYDGNDANSPLIGVATGTGSGLATGTSAYVSTTGATMFVVLATDNFPKSGGIFMNVSTHAPPVFCPPVQYVNFSAPNTYDYSEPARPYFGFQGYAPNRTCQWIFDVAGAFLISSTYDSLNRMKPGDVLELRHGDARAGELVWARTVFDQTASIVLDKGRYSLFFVSQPGQKLGYLGPSFTLQMFYPDANSPTTNFLCSGYQFVNVTLNNRYVTNPSPSTYTTGATTFGERTCQWQFHAGAPTQPLLQALFYGSVPAGARFYIYDGPNTSSPVIPFPASYSSGTTIYAHSGDMLVVLVSAPLTSLPIFSISLSSLATPQSCANGSVTYIDADYFQISEPSVVNIGLPYTRGRTCQWIIKETTGQLTDITASTIFNLNPNDTITVATLSASNVSTVVRTWTGPGPFDMRQISVSAQRLLITFTSLPGPASATGFILYGNRAYAAPLAINHCSGLRTLTLSGPPFTQDQSFVSEPNISTTNAYYGSGLNCGWRVSAPGYYVDACLLGFLNLRPGDYLRFYDGVDATAPLLFNFTGKLTSAFDLSASGSNMYISLTTLSAPNTYTGFNIPVNAKTSPGTQWQTTCPGEGSYTISASSGQQSYHMDTYNVQRGRLCQILITRTDWTATTGGIYVNCGAFSVLPTPAETITFYDGMTTSSPVLMQFKGANGWAGSTTAVSQSPYLLVTYQLATNDYLNGQFYFAAEAANFPASAVHFCSGLVAIDTRYNPGADISPTGWYLATIQPNMQCAWLLDATQTGNPDDRLSFGLDKLYDQQGYGTPDLKANHSYFAIYDGSNSSAPLLFDQNSDPQMYYQTKTQQAYITFSSDAGPFPPHTFGFHLTYARNTVGAPCANYSRFDLLHGAVTLTAATTFSVQWKSQFPIVRTCVWELHNEIGTVYLVTSFRNLFNYFTTESTETLRIYDGSPDNHTLLFSMDAADDPIPPYLSFASSSNYLYVVYDTGPVAPVSPGFVFSVQPVIPPSAQCAPNIVADYAMQIVYGNAYPLVTLIDPYIELQYPFSGLSGTFPAQSDTDCWIHFPCPTSHMLSFTIATNLEDGILSIFQDGQLLSAYTGAVYNAQLKVCRPLDVHIQIGNATKNTFWEMFLSLIPPQGSAPFPLECQLADDVPCTSAYSLTFSYPSDINPYVNCTILPMISLNAYASSGVYAFPKLRALNQVGATPWGLGPTLAFPALESVSNFYLSGPYSDAFVLPRLVFVNSLSISLANGMLSLSIPALVTAGGQVNIASLGSVVSISFANLTSAGSFVVSGSPLLLTVSTPKLRRVLTNYQLSNNDNLATADFALLDVVGTFYIYVCAFTDASLPKVVGPTSISVCGSDIVTANYPRLKGAFSFNFHNVDTLQSLTAPLLQWAHAGLSFQGKMTYVVFPLLETVNQFTLNQVTSVFTLDLPKLTYINILEILQTSAYAINMPALTLVTYSMRLLTNYQLTVIDFCALTSAPPIQFASNPELSCQETNTMFGAIEAGFYTAPPDCNPNVVATFGCQRDVVHPVNTTQCGHSVACIQAAIDLAYGNRDAVVSIPAGTYTGCSTPLTARGKLITVRGSGQDVTVIDCGGMGFAWVVNDGETANFTIEFLTFRNGLSVTDGGLLQITDASPTLRNVTFQTGEALRGGLVSITGLLSNPTFEGCTFTGGLAASGGALVVSNQATALLRDVSVTMNGATEHGGALHVTGASMLLPVSIQGGIWQYNSAPQGGAVFTDSPVVIGGGALFTRNSAAQFGGALAAVTANAATPVYVNTSDVLFSYNEAPIGGALLFFSTHYSATSGTELSFNHASGDGGALAALCSPSYRILKRIPAACRMFITLDDVVVSNNTAGGNGGGLSVTDAELNIYGGIWRFNAAQGGSGGAVQAADSDVSVASSLVESNSASTTGGGVYCEPFRGACDLSFTTLTSNQAALAGGGLFLCTTTCPGDRGSDASAFPSLASPIFTANAFEEGGYGADMATDATTLRFPVILADEVESGQALNSTADLSVAVYDAFGSIVTTSASALAVSLAVSGAVSDSGEPLEVAVAGTTTALAESGVATFSGASVAAVSVATTGRAYNLTATLSGTSNGDISLTHMVKVLPCAPGEGFNANSSLVVCEACVAGTAGSVDTGYVCLPCAAGSYAATAKTAVCTPCAASTYADQTGATTCLPCPSGSDAPAGSTACATQAAFPILPVAVSGSAIFVILLIVAALVLYRLARRKTMQKYYLDEDSTIRTGEETPLMKAVRRILGSASTTRAGGGQYADVYKARYENKWVALKVLKKEHLTAVAAQTEFRQEAVALGRLMQENCTGIVGLVFFLERNPMCVATEFCSNGTLKRFLRQQQLGIFDKLRLVTEAAAGMAVVHANNIAHLDLKTDNLLLDDDCHVKIADFGICRMLDGSASSSDPLLLSGSAAGSIRGGGGGMNANPAYDANSMHGSAYASGMGAPGQMDTQVMTHNSLLNSTGSMTSAAAFTPQYVDPLRLLSTDQDATFLKQSDIFTFGIVMWAIYAQEEPHADVAPDDLIKQLKSNPALRPPPIEGIHLEYDRVMRACWDSQPSARPAFSVVLEIMRGCLYAGYGMDLAVGYLPGSMTGELGSVPAPPTGSSMAFVPPERQITVAPPPPPIPRDAPADVDTVRSG